jgi:hypothetical protein
MKTLLTLVVILSTLALRAETDAPAIVTEGLKAYFTPGRSAAVDLWLRGSPLSDDRSTANKINDALARIEREYGRMIGSEPIRVVAVAPSLRRVYVLLKFEKGPGYGVFDCYRAEKDWVITTLDFNAKSAAIMPSNLLGEERQ